MINLVVTGAVYDMTSSYNASFYFAGILMALAGIVPCAIPYLHRQREHERDDDSKPCTLFLHQAIALLSIFAPSSSTFKPLALCALKAPLGLATRHPSHLKVIATCVSNFFCSLRFPNDRNRRKVFRYL